MKIIYDIFLILVALCFAAWVVTITLLIASESDQNIINIAECVNKQAVSAGFTGTDAEAWTIFANYCK